MLLFALKYACFAQIAITNAGVLRVPIEKHDLRPSSSANALFNSEFRAPDPHSGEQPLIYDHHHGQTTLRDLGWRYAIFITVGTPPQTIIALLDINWDGFFVQSSYCDTYLCSKNPHFTFNHTSSSTYVTYRPTYLSYDGVNIRGNLSSDRTTIADTDIPGLYFLDADDIEPYGWVSFYSGYSGVVGLSRDSSSSRFGAPSVWEMLLENEWLDRNVFSLSFPQGPERFGWREPGEFVLGAYPEGFVKDDAIALPLKDSYGDWATSVESLRFGPDVTEEFEDGIAYFSTDNPFILVPKDLFERISNAIGEDFRNGPGLDCKKRGELPKLTLGIGGQNCVLDGFQYTAVMNVTENLCVLGFHWWEGGDINGIGLGGAFMENYLMVFDADDGSIFISE